MGPSESARPLELADAIGLGVGDSAALSVDDLVFALGDGDLGAVERLADRTLAEGTTAVSIPIRAASRHFPAAASGGMRRTIASVRSVP